MSSVVCSCSTKAVFSFEGVFWVVRLVLEAAEADSGLVASDSWRICLREAGTLWSFL